MGIESNSTYVGDWPKLIILGRWEMNLVHLVAKRSQFFYASGIQNGNAIILEQAERRGSILY